MSAAASSLLAAGVAGDLPLRPATFFPDPAAMPSLDFDSARGDRAAWYRQVDGTPVLGMRIARDQVFAVSGGTRALLGATGVLLRHANGRVEAVQAERFAADYLRCLENGDPLCALTDSPQRQAKALFESNAANQSRNDNLRRTSLLRSLFRWRLLAKQSDQYKNITRDIHAHVMDLTRGAH